jgi:hypothetical protein
LGQRNFVPGEAPRFRASCLKRQTGVKQDMKKREYFINALLASGAAMLAGGIIADKFIVAFAAVAIIVTGHIIAD